MNHDELLAAVQFNKQTLESSDRNSEALRAVVELATRETISRTQFGEEFFEGFHFAMKCVREVIEEELK